MSVRNMTLNHLMVRLQLWRFWECGVLLHYHYSHVHSDPEWLYLCCILTFDPAKHTIPKWCTGRKWHIPMASNRKKSRRRIWLTKWDKVKAHDTLIDWCTGREWPLNCMTVISAWWRSNMPFQRLSGWLSGRLNYHITRRGQEVVGKATPGRRGPRDPQWVLETRWWQDVLEKASTQQKDEPPGLRLSIWRTRKTQRWWP